MVVGDEALDLEFGEEFVGEEGLAVEHGDVALEAVRAGVEFFGLVGVEVGEGFFHSFDGELVGSLALERGEDVVLKGGDFGGVFGAIVGEEFFAVGGEGGAEGFREVFRGLDGEAVGDGVMGGDPKSGS